MGCDRLNLLLVPIVFKRHSFTLGTSSPGPGLSAIIREKELPVLPALGIALSVTALELLDCEFHYSRNLDYWRGCVAAVSRLSHICHLRFDISCDVGVPYPWSTVQERDEWCFLLASLFNAASERADCIFTVTGRMFGDTVIFPFRHKFRAIPQAAPKGIILAPSIFHTLFRQLRAWLDAKLVNSTSNSLVTVPTHAEFVQLEHSSDLYTDVTSADNLSDLLLPAPTRPALRTFNIHTSFLFYSFFYRWTMHTLNSAPITALSLLNIDLGHYDWNIILPALSMPSLSDLSIGDSAIAFPDLFRFLARHPTIVVLDLSFNLVIGRLVPHASKDLLPRLQCLRATPDYLVHFLEPPSVYPHLREVAIASDEQSSYAIQQFHRVVNLLACRPTVLCTQLAGKLASHCKLPEEAQYTSST
ncbi:hypothetical protein C8J57DRAFT_1287592 [Mycena rebaudengoi]|nr:hypothetical protein C8J57DRAFT_1287592 [Mycena rebaudengoi]